jgi:hypothetical protein
MRLARLFSASMLLVTLTACEGYQPPAAPTPAVNPAASTTPARLVLSASARPDQRIDLSAQVLNVDGHGLPNVVVTFGIGAGSISPATAPTGVSGIAHASAVSTSWTTITATIAGGLTDSVDVLPSR